MAKLLNKFQQGKYVTSEKELTKVEVDKNIKYFKKWASFILRVLNNNGGPGYKFGVYKKEEDFRQNNYIRKFNLVVYKSFKRGEELWWKRFDIFDNVDLCSSKPCRCCDRIENFLERDLTFIITTHRDSSFAFPEEKFKFCINLQKDGHSNSTVPEDQIIWRKPNVLYTSFSSRHRDDHTGLVFDEEMQRGNDSYWSSFTNPLTLGFMETIDKIKEYYKDVKPQK